MMAVMTQVHLEPKRLRFVHHRQDKDSGLVLVEGRKNGNPGLKVEAPLVLSDAEGRETAEYRRIYHRESTS
jgi:tRNA1(Val) A37 N6-methylase TrmN6